MKKILYIILITTSLMFLVSCKDEKQVDIVTTSYVSYDIVNNITQGALDIENLVQPGVELHGFTPTSKQMVMVKKSKLFIYTSYEIDEWLNNNIKNVIGTNTTSFDMSLNIKYDKNDPHFWTNTLNYIDLVKSLKDILIHKYPGHKEKFELNANYYISELNYLDKQMLNTFVNGFDHKHNVYFSGHNALEAFQNRYNLNITSLSHTNKPDADLTLNQINDLLKEIQINNITYLFTEELSNNKVANTIKNEVFKKNGTTLILLELHSYHNITLEDFNNNVTYKVLLERNYANLQLVLGL